ncbi:uncharacterized protein LOC135206558 [Macrobrachium nipponense]|uniref:uncharacterized protein LOC135206558 n=1 Tax=Macrobrachium nipponense TaxID=159736 RepID=UPI0030C7D837
MSSDKDSSGSRPYHRGSTNGSYRPRNLGAFVLKDSLKSHQESANEKRKEFESYTKSQIGIPVLQKAPKGLSQKAVTPVDKEMKGNGGFPKSHNFPHKRKNVLRTKVVKKKKSRSNKNTPEKLNIGAHGRRSSEPHPGFFRDHTPDCALHTNRTFCFMDETYPSDFMKQQLTMYGDILQKLWRPYSPISVLPKPPSTSASHSKKARKPRVDSKGHPNSSVSVRGYEGYPCSSNMERRTLSQAKNTRGQWKMIVNVEGVKVGDPHLLQTTSLEECTAIGSSCSLLPKGLTTSRCVQRYTVHNLLTWDARAGFYVDSYELPTACVCYVSKINVSLISSYIGDWKRFQ